MEFNYSQSMHHNKITESKFNANINRTSSKGQLLIESNYLDSHYNAASIQYEEMICSVGFQKGWSVLDAGSGNGSFIPILSKLLGSDGIIHAIDLDAENVDVIYRHIENNEFSCKVVADIGNVTFLPFNSNSFDALWCSNVFQYLTDEEKNQALKEFVRVVRPGGLIAIKELDLTASFVCPDPIIFWHIVEKSSSSIQIHSTMRTHELPKLAFLSGLKVLSYKTFLVEWNPPLKPSDLPYLNAILQFFGTSAQDLHLTEQELSVMKRLSDPNSTDYYLNSLDFYWREAFAVVVCKVPI